MKTAFSIWNERIAPVFDVAPAIWLVDSDGVSVSSARNETLQGLSPESRAGKLAGLGAEVLICGAISRPMEEAISAAGIRVVAFVSGEAKEIIAAALEGHLEEKRFTMPGCGRRRGRHRGNRKRRKRVCQRETEKDRSESGR